MFGVVGVQRFGSCWVDFGGMDVERTMYIVTVPWDNTQSRVRMVVSLYRSASAKKQCVCASCRQQVSTVYV